MLHHSQLTATIIQSLKGSVDLNKEECVPLRYASVLISKGFTCSLLEIGINLEVQLRVVGSITIKGTCFIHVDLYLYPTSSYILHSGKCGRSFAQVDSTNRRISMDFMGAA